MATPQGSRDRDRPVAAPFSTNNNKSFVPDRRLLVKIDPDEAYANALKDQLDAHAQVWLSKAKVRLTPYAKPPWRYPRRYRADEARFETAPPASARATGTVTRRGTLCTPLGLCAYVAGGIREGSRERRGRTRCR